MALAILGVDNICWRLLRCYSINIARNLCVSGTVMIARFILTPFQAHYYGQEGKGASQVDRK